MFGVTSENVRCDPFSEVTPVWTTGWWESHKWLIDELGLPVGAEALRLRAKAEGWEKGAVMLGKANPKLAPKPKLGKVESKLGKAPKPKLAQAAPSLDDGGFELLHEPAALSKVEHEEYAPLEPREERFEYSGPT
ncbi:hypothetical protein [Polaromonas hydrogenivorans]|uniref:Uncharacterized protein n=1 Tax=Polaromonas hydrogenivorans TaxID=335476 RepID=A0AAU7LVL8_9BURK